MYDIIAQGIGFLAMALSVMSFQMNTKKKIIIMQIMTAVVFIAHYSMIGAVTAAVVNFVAIGRNLVFYHKNIFTGKFWVPLCACIMALCALLSWEGPVSLLMCVGMIFNTLAVAAETPVGTRKMILISSPFVLIYNILVFSLGGIVNEALVIVITTITLMREKQKS